MHRITWPTLAGLLVCGAVFVGVPIAPAGESPAFAPAPPASTFHLFCTAAQPTRELADGSVVPEAIYYSGAFSVTIKILKPVDDGFLQFLQERYGYQPDPSLGQSVMCYSRKTLADVQAERQQYLTQSLQYAARLKVVETDWVFTAN